MRIRLTALALVIYGVSVFFSDPSAPGLAGGPMIVVDTAADDNMAFNGNCTLREAVTAARTNNSVDACPMGHPAGTDVIELQAGQTYDLGGNGDLLVSGGPVVFEALGGVGNAVIDAGDQHRVMRILEDTAVELNDLTITNGNSDTSSGGGISLNQGGSLTLNRVHVINNRAVTIGGGVSVAEGGTLRVSHSLFMGNDSADDSGGGLTNSGDASITDTAFIENSAGAAGAAIRNTGTLTMKRSLIAGNTAGVTGGGGLWNRGSADLENVTIDGNEGGGIRITDGTLTATNVTISENFDDGTPAGIVAFFGEIVLKNTIISNGDGSANCTNEPITSMGGNLENGDTCGLGQPGDRINTDPQLGPLQDNGGPTSTRALLEGSPAIDAGDDSSCPDEDQRGEERPQGGGCDIGAYESPFTAPTPSPTPSPSPMPSPSPTPTGQQVIWGDHNCSGAPDPIDGLLTLRHDAGLEAETGACPEFGAGVTASAALTWGDVDCNGSIDPVDALKLLRYDAGLEVAQEAGCPEIGEPSA